MVYEVVRIFLNGVEVGALPRQDYDRIARDVRRDPAVFLDQALNLVSVLVRLFGNFAVVLALWLLGTFVLLALVECAAVIEFLPSASPSEIAAVISQYMLVSVTLVGVAVLLACIESVPGYKNRFRLARDFHIRRVLEEPADGPMHIVFADEARG